MGAKPVTQLAPFIMTKAIRNDTTWTKGPVWFYIYTHLRQWSKLGTYFDLPVVGDSTISNGVFNGMKVDAAKYYAEVKNVKRIDQTTVCLRIKVGRRFKEKRVDYRYGGVINYLDSDRDL